MYIVLIETIRSRTSKIFFLQALMAVFFSAQTVFAGSAKNLLLVEGGEQSAQEATNISFEKNILPTVQDYLLSAYIIIVIGMLLYMGFKLVTARGNEEEFKKAWIALVYVVIGLTIPPLSYVAIRIVTGFNF